MRVVKKGKGNYSSIFGALFKNGYQIGKELSIITGLKRTVVTNCYKFKLGPPQLVESTLIAFYSGKNNFI